MELEKEIRQKKFKNEYEKLAVNIIYTGNWLAYQDAQLFKKFGLTNQQYNVLRILRGQHPQPASVNLLKERMMDKVSNASRIVDKLVRKGLVERKICPSDRRAVDVKITEAGLKLLKEIEPVLKDARNRLKTLNEVEAHQLNELLDKLRG